MRDSRSLIYYHPIFGLMDVNTDHRIIFGKRFLYLRCYTLNSSLEISLSIHTESKSTSTRCNWSSREIIYEIYSNNRFFIVLSYSKSD